MHASGISNKLFSWTHSVWEPTEPIATRPLFSIDNLFRFPSPNGLGRIFSSEYHDDTLGLVYYRERERTFHGHYRHYNPIDDRWGGQDLVGLQIRLFVKNDVLNHMDILGKAVADKMTKLVHKEIGDSFEFSKIEAYLKGERDDFR